MAAPSFHLFPALPPELRSQIWESALSVPAVWAATRVSHTGDDVDSDTCEFTVMDFVGPAPPLAGISSREAWCLLKRSYVKPIHGPQGRTGKRKAHWVNLSHTVVFFGGVLYVEDILAGFDADALSRFQHVAFTWHISQFGPLLRACRHLATICPALNTIIIQCVKGLPQPLTPETAAHYAEVPAYTGHELDWQEIDTPYLRSQLLQYFGASPPRLHLLA